MVELMGVVNLTPDSYYAQSRTDAEGLPARIAGLLREGASIIDIGAVSTRPGAEDIGVEQEWQRLRPALEAIARERSVARAAEGSQGGQCAADSCQEGRPYALSIDTTSSEIVRKAHAIIGHHIVNDISAGMDDPEMLKTVSELGLGYIAMHKRGNPRTMDSQTDYPDGIIQELQTYFLEFEDRAEKAGLKDWIIDPGLGFAKTKEQNWEILERLKELSILGRPILISAQDKRFTGGDNEKAHRLAVEGGASILRVHRPADVTISH